MECGCDACEGTGRCGDCGGKGVVQVCASEFLLGLHPNDLGYDAAKPFIDDLHRIRKQAEELCRLRPERRSSYLMQEVACRKEIGRQFEEMLKKEEEKTK